MTTTREERRDVVDDPTYSLEVVHGKAGDCVCLNDRRICGPKPWGGGRITSTWSVRRSDILAAIPDLEAENDRLRASQAGGVPAGWKLVPVEPTPEMLANADVGGWPGFDALRAFWGAMLPASPPPPATDGDALTTLRAAGWMVAVHNDYRLAGRRMTFWLLTHADGRWIKGEAGTDAEALSICCEAAALASSPPLAATDAVEAERAANALASMRAAGWMVAVHNDYRLTGQLMTFWLFTHADGRWVKGEAKTDAEALAMCAADAVLARGTENGEQS